MEESPALQRVGILNESKAADNSSHSGAVKPIQYSEVIEHAGGNHHNPLGDDPVENSRRKKELYHICVRAIMNLPPDRRAIYDVFIRRKYGEEKQ